MRVELIFYVYMLEGNAVFAIDEHRSMLTLIIISMSVERDIRFDLIARLCPNTTGAELRSVATEVRVVFELSGCNYWLTLLKAGMFAIRARRKVATERDFLDAVEKVVRQGTKFSST